jgi:hypothetical protein
LLSPSELNQLLSADPFLSPQEAHPAPKKGANTIRLGAGEKGTTDRLRRGRNNRSGLFLASSVACGGLIDPSQIMWALGASLGWTVPERTRQVNWELIVKLTQMDSKQTLAHFAPKSTALFSQWLS